MQPGLRRAQGGVGVRCPGVDDRAGGQDQHHRLEGGVGVGLGAALHTRGVVGHHPADRARRLAGRVRAEASVVGRQVRVDHADGGARPDAHPLPAVEHLDAAEVPADVDQDGVGDRLPRQARARGPEGQRRAGAVAGGHHRGDLGLVGGAHDQVGHEQVVGGVVGQRMAVEHPARDAVRPQDPGELVAQGLHDASSTGPAALARSWQPRAPAGRQGPEGRGEVRPGAAPGRAARLPVAPRHGRAPWSAGRRGRRGRRRPSRRGRSTARCGRARARRPPGPSARPG